jgi:hypothetical protein
MADSDSDSDGKGGQPVPPVEPAESPEKPSCLVPELLCEYLKIPKSPTEVTLMLKVRAVAQATEDRRAPVTICAVIDRR